MTWVLLGFVLACLLAAWLGYKADGAREAIYWRLMVFKAVFLMGMVKALVNTSAFLYKMAVKLSQHNAK